MRGELIKNKHKLVLECRRSFESLGMSAAFRARVVEAKT